jgi:hypothetical protein
MKACRISHLTPHTSHLTPHTSHLTPHTSHLTPHTSSRSSPANSSSCSPKRRVPPCTMPLMLGRGLPLSAALAQAGEASRYVPFSWVTFAVIATHFTTCTCCCSHGCHNSLAARGGGCGAKQPSASRPRATSTWYTMPYFTTDFLLMFVLAGGLRRQAGRIHDEFESQQVLGSGVWYFAVSCIVSEP